eukprot:CAMPEP_0119506836 /NCGR_PEP_ID=MMETSP1344-20130328/26918_1 /TAXON_ID=236787 /ORGANISM="Florenciella parvula, Strain CCMP2471" /LENGTH=217 /DNA_ID=CAMNT_0007543407 /DNA_START=109 /DNA_END=762 /DNA_ORIENTATION=+
MAPAVPLESLDFILGFTAMPPPSTLQAFNKRPNTTFDEMEFMSWGGIAKMSAETQAKAPSKKRRRTEAKVADASPSAPSKAARAAQTNALVAQWLSVGEWNNMKTAERTTPAFHTELCDAANTLGLGLGHEYEAHEPCTCSCTEHCHVSAASEENHKYQQRLIAQTKSLIPVAAVPAAKPVPVPAVAADGKPRGLGEVDNGMDSSDCISFLDMQGSR